MRALVVVALLCSVVGAAHAGDETDQARVKQARQFYESGKASYDKGQYLVSITAFEEAYRLEPRASVVFALASAYRKQWLIDGDDGKLRRAVTLLREYQTLPRSDRAEQAEAFLDELEPELDAVDQKAAAAAAAAPAPSGETKTTVILTARLDDARVVFDGGAPVDLPVVLDTAPGRHRILAFAIGHDTDERDVFAVEGQTVSVEVELVPLPTVVTVRSESGAKIAVDGRVAGRANQPISISAGSHQVAVLARGRRAWKTDLEVDGGGELSIDATLHRSPRRLASYVAAGGAGILAIASGISVGFALDAQSDVRALEDKLAAGETLTRAERNAHNHWIDRRDRWRGDAFITGGAAVAALAVAAYLYFSDTPSPPEYLPGVAAVPGGATLTVARSF
jgi:hypothetical protein